MSTPRTTRYVRYHHIPDGFVRFVDVCQMYHVHPSTARNACTSGKIAHEICLVDGCNGRVFLVCHEQFQEWEKTRKRIKQPNNHGMPHGAHGEIVLMLRACRDALNSPSKGIRTAAREVIQRWLDRHVYSPRETS